MSNKTFVIAIFSVFFSLSNHSYSNNFTGEKAGKVSAPTADRSIRVDSIFLQMDSFVGKIVTIEGTCSHLCPHGGTKMFLRGSNPKKFLRVEAGDLGRFPKESIGKKVKVTGILSEIRIDEAYINELLKENEDGSCSGCEDSAIRKQAERYRNAIAERTKKEGISYLSSYYLAAESFSIL